MVTTYKSRKDIKVMV
jgi:hypothetical protein